MLVGSGRVELLAPLGAETPVGRFLASRGPGMHHVAYEVDDVGAALDSLAGAGAELIDDEPREGLFGLQVAFVHPDAVHGVLTEVVSVVQHVNPTPSVSSSPSTAARSCPRSSPSRAPTSSSAPSRPRRAAPSCSTRPTAATPSSLARVVYMKRYARESRVGFGI